MNNYIPDFFIRLGVDLSATEKDVKRAYAKRLKSFGANNIHIRYRGKRRLTYPISDNTIGDYIQIRFSIIPKNLNAYLELIKLDEKLLRSFLLRLHNNNIE